MTDELAERRRKLAAEDAERYAKKFQDPSPANWPDPPPTPDGGKLIKRALEPLRQHDELFAPLLEELALLVLPAIEQLAPTLMEERGHIPKFEANLGTVELDSSVEQLWPLKSVQLCAKATTGSWEFEMPPKHPSGPMMSKELRLFELGSWYELSWMGRWHASGDNLVYEAVTLVHVEHTEPFVALGGYTPWAILGGMDFAFRRNHVRPTGELAHQYLRFLERAEKVAKAGGPSAELLQLSSERTKKK